MLAGTLILCQYKTTHFSDGFFSVDKYRMFYASRFLRFGYQCNTLVWCQSCHEIVAFKNMPRRILKICQIYFFIEFFANRHYQI